jgi:uncharacterized membrane protein YoaK (UPF0700 family)
VDAPRAPSDAGGEPAAGSLRHPLTRSLLLLTFGTGIVDAVSYIGLGRVFAANMTGNVVLLGFGIAGGTHLPVVAPVVSLVAFLVGGMAGGQLAGRLAKRRALHLAVALTVEVGLVLTAAILAVGIHVRAGRFSGDMVIALLALGMGVRNATVRTFAVPDLTTTVLTMTLTGLASGLPWIGRDGPGTVRRSAAVLAMCAGAVVGALLLKTDLELTLFMAAAVGACAWPIYAPARRYAAVGAA